MFGLLPNLNWFDWVRIFYIYCMHIMSVLCKYNVFRFKPWINLCMMIVILNVLEVVLHSISILIILGKYSTGIWFSMRCFSYTMCVNGSDRFQ